MAGGGAAVEDVGNDGKMEDAVATGAAGKDDLAAGARSPSSGSGTAVAFSCLTPGFRLSKENGHRTPSVESSSSVGAAGTFFSSDS